MACVDHFHALLNKTSRTGCEVAMPVMRLVPIVVKDGLGFKAVSAERG